VKIVFLSVLICSVLSGVSHAQDLTDRSIVYSDLRLKCSTPDKKLSLYVSAKGDIFRNQSNALSWAIYSSKYEDWFISNKKNETFKNLYNSYLSYSINHSDPFGFKYEVKFEKLAYFKNNRKTKAILTRVHSHPEININQSFELNCLTTVSTKKVPLKPITVGRFNRLKAEHKSYVLTSIADTYTDDSEIELTPKQEDTYTYYATTGFADSVYKIKDVKNVTRAQKLFLKNLIAIEDADQKDCIDDRLSYHDVDTIEREEILENWSICSYEVYIVRDSSKIVIGFVVDRYNDNGVDDSDGHDGSATTFNSRGKELGYSEWYP
jgi:hypothetical protein